MIILDTNHINELQGARGPKFQALSVKMAASTDQDFVTTAVTLEEQMRGWLALVHRLKDPHKQVFAYTKLNEMVDYYSRWNRLPFDDLAADRFQVLRSQKVRIGTMDLKIAAICLVHSCILLSANTRDFQQIPNLHVEDWLT